MTKTKKTLLVKYSLVQDVLEFLISLGEMVPRPFESPYEHMRRLRRAARGIPEPKKWEYNRAIRQLVERKQVIISREEGKVFIQLTQKGKLNALFKRLSHVKSKGSKWDGKWRLMIWDIPETSRKQRDAVRWFVKSLGFYQLQRSVFILPSELPIDAVNYLEESGLNKFIRFLRVDKIDNDRLLRSHFNL